MTPSLLNDFRCLVKLEKKGKIHNIEKTLQVYEHMIRN